jgi:Fur family ferric uptake transcriptional regulator
VDAGIEERQNSVAERLGFSISEHALVIYGHCQRTNCPHRGKKTAD